MLLHEDFHFLPATPTQQAALADTTKSQRADKTVFTMAPCCNAAFSSQTTLFIDRVIRGH